MPCCLHVPSVERVVKNPHLVTGVVYVVLTLHFVTGCIENVRQAAADNCTTGVTDMTAVSKSIRYQVESSVAGVKGVTVDRVRRGVPGAFEGRLVRVGALGSRFAAVAEYLNECTNYPVTEGTWIVLDGSEAGPGC